MSTINSPRAAPLPGAALCIALAVIGSLFAVVNPFTGMVIATAALSWSLIAVRSGRPVDSYLAARWIAAAALLINTVTLLLSLTWGVAGATTPIVVPVDPR